MAIVRTKIFQRTLPHVQISAEDVTDLIARVEDLANVFCATLPAASVLDIQSTFTQAGKYGAFAHYQLRVTFLQ